MLTDTFRTLLIEPSQLLISVLRALKVTQIQIGPPKPDIDTTATSSLEAVEQRLNALSYLPPDSTIASFQNRGPHLDELRDIVTRGSERVIVITGLPGIGKTELINTLFLKVLTDWRPVWMRVALESSMARLVAEIGATLGYAMDADSLGTATENVFRQKIEKLLVSLFSTERHALILDDLKDLRMSKRGYRQLQIFLEVATDVKPYIGSRIFVISSASTPPLWMQRAGIARIHIRGLDEKYIRRVLEYKLREARLLPGESAADVPQNILNAIDGHPLAAKIAAVASAQKGCRI